MKEEPMRDALLEFNCLGCQRKAHHPVLTRCGHLFWYTSIHLVGSATTTPRFKPRPAPSAANPPPPTRSTRSLSRTTLTRNKTHNFLNGPHPKISPKSQTRT